MTRVLDLDLSPGDDELLTTGKAAKLLGVSRQHVVDLCDSGELPAVRVGAHRRIALRDVERIKGSATTLTRDQLRSLLLGHAVAGRVVEDPDRARALARRNIERMRATSLRGSARVWIDEWASLVEGPLPDLLDALTSRSPRSRELRQNTPFAGMLSEHERAAVLAHVSRGSAPA